MKLPENYIHINQDCAVHISTLRKFTKDIRSFMNYLKISIEYWDYLKISNECAAMDDDEFLKNITIRCSAPASEVALRMREHGELTLAIAQLLENGNWFDDQPKPLFLTGESR